MDNTGDACFLGAQPVNSVGSTSFPHNQWYIKNNGSPGHAGVSARTYNVPWGQCSFFAPPPPQGPLCMIIPLQSLGIYSYGNILYNLNPNDDNGKFPQARRCACT